MTLIDQLFDETVQFGLRFESVLRKAGIADKCHGLKMDHVCVRLKNPDDVSTLHMQLKRKGKTISSATVNGRKIHIVQLWQPLNIGRWNTYGIELPYPKEGHSYPDGWEHVEFVLPDAEPTHDGILDAFWERFPAFAPAYKVSKPHAEEDQLPNPSVDMKLDGIGVKFHARSIQDVVGYQKPSQ